MLEYVTHVHCPRCGKSLKSNKPMKVGSARVRCPVCDEKFLVEGGDSEGPASRAVAETEAGTAAWALGPNFGRSPGPGQGQHPTQPAGRGAAGPVTPPSRTPYPPFQGGPQVAGYTLLAELGRGGMGVVYKARHERLKRIVALKLISLGPDAPADALADFQAEAEAAARIHHPYVLQIFEVGEHGGQPYLALEFAPGGTLKDRFAGQPQPIRAAVQLLEMLARAVHAAHLRGVVHRDLKPANVLLEHSILIDDRQGTRGAYPEASQQYGIPKIADFGLSVRMDVDAGLHRYGQSVGTPMYMAPEQAAGLLEEIGPPTDIYSLGAIFYEMLTGQPPFPSKTITEALHRLATEAPRPPRQLRPGLPRDLEAICLKCLEKDPRRRYRSALDLADDLRRFQDGEPVSARPIGPATRAWRWALRHPIPASLLLTIIATLAIGQWWLVHLSTQMVEQTALEAAAHQTGMIREVNKLYTDVAAQAKKGGLTVTHRFPDENKITVPIPARFTIMLGERLEQQAEQSADSGGGQELMRVKLYSNFPFRERPDSPPKHRFGIEALKHYETTKDTSAPFYEFDRYNGMRVLRYATPMVMAPRCLGCHNDPEAYSGASKTDWKVGDVRGVLEVITPLDESLDKTRQALVRSYLMLGGLAAALLGGTWAGLVVSRRRRTA